MEKIINEIKIVEIDDGFRIEIRGDKEAIRRMLRGIGAGWPFGRGFRFGFGPWSWNSFGGCWGPWQETDRDKGRA